MAGFNKPSKQNKRLTESNGTKNVKNPTSQPSKPKKTTTNGTWHNNTTQNVLPWDNQNAQANSRKNEATKAAVRSRGDNYGGYSPGTTKTQGAAKTETKASTSSHRNYYNYGSLHYPTPTKVQNSDMSKRGYPSSTNPSSQPSTKKTQTSRISPEHQSTKPGIQSDIKRRQGGGITDRTVNKGTNAAPKNSVGDIIRKGFDDVQKKRWNKEDAMRERREAAKAQGKGNWNKEEVMKQRREEAKKNGKGTWNKEEAMKKRREEAMAKKKGK